MASSANFRKLFCAYMGEALGSSNCKSTSHSHTRIPDCRQEGRLPLRRSRHATSKVGIEPKSWYLRWLVHHDLDPKLPWSPGETTNSCRFLFDIYVFFHSLKKISNTYFSTKFSLWQLLCRCYKPSPLFSRPRSPSANRAAKRSTSKTLSRRWPHPSSACGGNIIVQGSPSGYMENG